MRFDAKQLTEMSKSVRAHALDALRRAGSGHVGIVLSMADVVTTIYANFLRPGRDRFVLSAGHGSALLYSVLKLAGYRVGDLDSLRQMGGLPGHPEFGIDGVNATTGPLGQGIGNAVGMALAAKIRGTDEVVYCVCSDGDLMEGVAAESIAFAGRYGLDNLVLLWDDNGVSIDGVALTDMDVPLRMRAAGWAALQTPGDDFKKIMRALQAARENRNPVFIQCKTIIGCGSSLAGRAAAHGFALSDAEMMQLVEKNIFCRTGSMGGAPAFGAIYIHGGCETRAKRNVFIECESAFGCQTWADDRYEAVINSEAQWRKTHIDVEKGVYPETYPNLSKILNTKAPRINYAEENKVYNTSMAMNGDLFLRYNKNLRPNNGVNPADLLSVKKWTLEDVKKYFGEDPLVKNILSVPMGLKK